MGLAIDTVGFNATTGATANTFADAAADSGDSLTVRQFAQGSLARLEFIGLDPAAAGVTQVEVKSPALADNVEGILMATSEGPAAFLMPRERGEQLTRGDTLGVSVATSLASATVIGGALGIYYANLDGIDASLKMWSDFSAQIDHIKSFNVTPGAATANTWDDTSINTGAAQLDADRYYAVLGFMTNDPYIAVGIKGQSTGNLRVCGPGTKTTLDMTDYFVEVSAKHGTPHVPVFYANNRAATYLSVLSVAAVASPNPVTLVCAELAAGFKP